MTIPFDIDAAFHDPDWRWEEACRLHRIGLDPPRHADPHVARVWHYQHVLAQETRPDERVSVNQYPIITAAHAIYEREDAIRWAIEAWLLTGVGDAEVSRRTGVDTEIIEMYRLVFFDVVDKLKAGDWIALKVLGTGPATRTPHPIEPWIWRLAAVAFGPVALEILIGDFTGTPVDDIHARHQQAHLLRLCGRMRYTGTKDKVALEALKKDHEALLAAMPEGPPKERGLGMMATCWAMIEQYAEPPGKPDDQPRNGRNSETLLKQKQEFGLHPKGANTDANTG